MAFKNNKQIKPHLKNYFMSNPGSKIEKYVDYAVYSNDRLFRLPFYAKFDKPTCLLSPVKVDK